MPRYPEFILRLVVGICSGLLGMLVGWAGLAYILVITSGPDRDGGIAMGAFFGVGPIGGVFGFIAGVLLFVWKGIVRKAPQQSPETPADGDPDPSTPSAAHISRPFAIIVLFVIGGLAWGIWYEFIRSPYLSHGDQAEMTLALQFRLPAGISLPEHSDDVNVDVNDGDGRAFMTFGESWFGPKWYRRDGDRQILLASAELSKITHWRTVRLDLPGMPSRIWSLGISSDPYPIPDYTQWHAADDALDPKIEMRFRLTADRCSVCAFEKE